MKFLLEPRDGTWVAMADRFRKEDGSWPDHLTALTELRERVSSPQKWYMDFDDNHAPSPAKEIAKRALGTSRFNPTYVRWAAGTAWALATKGKAAESERWKAYIDHFLQNFESIEEVAIAFPPEHLCFYAGVPEWCSLLVDQNAALHYISRNIEEVLSAYIEAMRLQTDGKVEPLCHQEIFDKAAFVQQHSFCHRPPLYIRPSFGVEGDSSEDGDMIDALRQHNAPVVGIYSMDSPRGRMDPRFDYAVSKDRRGLVELLKI